MVDWGEVDAMLFVSTSQSYYILAGRAINYRAYHIKNVATHDIS